MQSDNLFAMTCQGMTLSHIFPPLLFSTRIRNGKAGKEIDASKPKWQFMFSIVIAGLVSKELFLGPSIGELEIFSKDFLWKDCFAIRISG